MRLKRPVPVASRNFLSDKVAASFALLLRVHRNGDVGPPRVSGSTSRLSGISVRCLYPSGSNPTVGVGETRLPARGGNERDGAFR